MYIFLLILLLILLLFFFPLCNYEIFNPSIILILMFFICAFFGLNRWKAWELKDYGSDAVFLIFIGILSFASVSVLVSAFYKSLNNIEPIRHDRINIPLWFEFFMIIVGIVGTYMMYKYITSTVIALGKNHSTFSQTLYSYYIIRVNGENVNEYAMPTVLSLIYRVMPVFCGISEYVLVHNICFRQWNQKDIPFIAIIILDIIFSLLMSNRTVLLQVMSVGIYLSFFFLNMYRGWNRDVNSTILKKGAKIFVIFMITFVLLAVGLGRYTSLSDFNLLAYVSSYTSSGIRAFDLYLKKPVKSNIWGKETFYSLNRFLANRFGIGELYSAPLEFRSISGKNIGNIYTGFRRYYSDFGLLGVIILPAIMSLIFSIMYYYNRNKAYSDNTGAGLLVLAYLIRSVFWMPIEDYFFVFYVSVGTLFEILLLILLYNLFVHSKFRVVI